MFSFGQSVNQQPVVQPGSAPAVQSVLQAPTTTGLFGQTTTGLFGQQQPASTAFGQQPATGSTGMFGQSNATGMFKPQQQQQQQQQSQIVEEMQRMAQCWNPQSPMCNFKFYFYNMVHPSEVHLYQATPQDQGTYEQAQLNNPDPSCMVPVLAVGFGDLKKRMEAQEQQIRIHKEKLELIASSVATLQSKHFVDTLARLEEYKRKQRQIVHKVYQLLKTVQLLRNRGYSIRADEEALKARLEAMERDLQNPSIFRGRLNELWAQLQQLKDSKRLNEDSMFAVVDDDALQPVFDALVGMQSGLSEITRVLQSDSKDVDQLAQGYRCVFPSRLY